MAMLGDSSRLSLIASGSLTNAALGGESKDGNGSPSFEVTHRIPSGSITLVAVQPAGSAGGVTPSKVSLNTVAGPGQRDGWTHASSASTLLKLTPATPPAANNFAPTDVPEAKARNSLRLGASDQLSSSGSYTYPALLKSGVCLLILAPEARRCSMTDLFANVSGVEAKGCLLTPFPVGPNGFPPPKTQSLSSATALPATLFWTPGMLVFCVHVSAAMS